MVLYPNRMYSFFRGSKSPITDFSLSKKSLSYRLLSLNDQNINGLEWNRHIPLSCLVCQHQMKKFYSPEILNLFIWFSGLSTFSHQLHPKNVNCFRNRTRKQSLGMWLCILQQAGEEGGRNQGLKFSVLFPRYGHTFRSFINSSIGWSRGGYSLLYWQGQFSKVVIKFLISSKEWFMRLPWASLLCKSASSGLAQPGCTTGSYLLSRFHADRLIHTLHVTNPPPRVKDVSTPSQLQSNFSEGVQVLLAFHENGS